MRKNLLLVDDEVALLDTMKELLLLEDDSLQIFTARNGEEALQVMLNQDLDCVISDIKMPKMDGLTLIKKAREYNLSAPFIFYSGHACEKLSQIACDLGAAAMFSKPNFFSLEEAVFAMINERRPARELLA